MSSNSYNSYIVADMWLGLRHFRVHFIVNEKLTINENFKKRVLHLR